VYANLDHVLGGGVSRFTRWRYGRSAFRHFAYSIIDIFLIPGLTLENLNNYVSAIHGIETVEACRAAGKGGIFITVHMGSWELAGAYEGLRGVPLAAVALPHRDPRVDRLYQDIRRNVGMESVPVDGALYRLREALRQGRFTAMLADRDVSGRGLELPFFGQVTRVPAGHAVLALWTGAWILPACFYRRPDGGLVIECRAPIIPDRTRDTKESLTLRCLKILEEFIRARPEQWTCFYDLWNQPSE
jgi:KDO2-lipid IV(A) lauroyltransferase